MIWSDLPNSSSAKHLNEEAGCSLTFRLCPAMKEPFDEGPEANASCKREPSEAGGREEAEDKKGTHLVPEECSAALVQDRHLMSHGNAHKDGRNTVLCTDEMLSDAPAAEMGSGIYGAVLHMNCTVNRLPPSAIEDSQSVRAFSKYSQPTVDLVGLLLDCPPPPGGEDEEEMRQERELGSGGEGGKQMLALSWKDTNPGSLTWAKHPTPP